MTALDDQKAALRKVQAVRRKEASLHHDDVVRVLAGHGGDLIAALNLAKGDIVAGFWPIRSELDPRPLMAALVDQGMKTALPATPKPGAPLIFHKWRAGDAVVDGLYGTSEPDPSASVVIPKLILVPLLAFDRRGYRLGYGGGFYDRSLAQLRDAGHVVHCVGIAYEAQQVEQVPIGPHDAKLDGVLTEAGFKQPSGDE